MANVEGTIGAGRIQRLSSNPELSKQASHEALAQLKQGLHNQSAGDLASKPGGSPSGGGDPGAAGDDSSRHGNGEVRSPVSFPLSPPVSPTSVAAFQTPPRVERYSDESKGVVRNLYSELGANAANSRVVVGGGSEPDGVAQPLMFGSGGGGGVEANRRLSSPLRTRSAENIEGLRELKASIKKELKDAFSPSSSAPSEVIAESHKPLKKDPAAIAMAMTGVYCTPNNDLDVFVEAFGEVLAEKASTHPEAFHAFFQTKHGGLLGVVGHIKSMKFRFGDGFEHRLGQIQKESPLTVRDVADAQKEILHANIAGGNSCIQSLEKTLVEVSRSLTVDIEKGDPRILLINDIAQILMSDTNRGDISDPNSGIATLRDAIVASPTLAAFISELESSSVIRLLAKGFETQILSVALLSASPSSDNAATVFYQAWKTAAALDILATRTGVSVNRGYEKALYPPTRFGDFSSISTRKDLDAARSSQSKSFKTTVATRLAHLQSFSAEPAFGIFTSALDTATETATKTLESKCTERLVALCKDFRADLPNAFLSSSLFPGNRRNSLTLTDLAKEVIAFSTRYDDLYRAGDTIPAEKQLSKDLETFAGLSMKHAATQLITEFLEISRGTHEGISENQKPESSFKSLFSPLENGSVKRVYDIKLKELQGKLEAKLKSVKPAYKEVIHELYRAMGHTAAIMHAEDTDLRDEDGKGKYKDVETQLALITADIPKIKDLHQAYSAACSALLACETAEKVEGMKQELLDSLNVGPKTHSDMARTILAGINDSKIKELKISEDTAAAALDEKARLAAEAVRVATAAAHALSVKAAQAAEETRKSEISALGQTMTTLTDLLKQTPVDMAARATLLKTAYGQLQSISRETTRLFPGDGKGSASHVGLKNLSEELQAVYTRFCTTDSKAIMAESGRSLGAIATASGSGIAGIAEGLATAHGQTRDAFETAYTIEGLSSEPRDKGLATLGRFTGLLSEEVALRREAFRAIATAVGVAQRALTDAMAAAQAGIDFGNVTAQTLRDRIGGFTAACAAAESKMTTALRNIRPDADQPQVFGPAVTTAHESLKAAFTTEVSASFTNDKATLSALSAATLIADLTAQVPMAVALKTRAAGLSEFLEPRLLEEINRITNAHFARTLTAAETIANASLAAAQRTAQTMRGTQPRTETAAELTARMTAFDRAAQAALTAFDTAVFGIPDYNAHSMGISGTQSQMKGKLQLALKTAVSAPLEITKARIDELLANPATTLDRLSLQFLVVQTLKTRRDALGDVWLTAGMGATIDRTVAAYEEKVEALQTRAGQIRDLTGALAELTFEGPVNATLQDKWTTIKTHSDVRDILMGHEDYSAIMTEDPKDPAITHSLTQLEARKTAAIEDRVPEQRALIAGLSAQLATLATGFDWAATLTTAETAARNTLPVDLQTNVEMQAALTAAKGTLNGLQNAVTTRVAAREALATATTSLDGWPAQGRLDAIQREVAAARAAWTPSQIAEFAAWDTATYQEITRLEAEIVTKIGERDTLIRQFQAIIDTPLPVLVLGNPFNPPTVHLSEKWTEILRQVTAANALHTANVAGTGTGLIQDPQVAAKIQETRANSGTKVAVTDVERDAFRDAMNRALLTYDVTVLQTVDGLLDTAAVQMQSGLSDEIKDSSFFKAAVTAVRTENVANGAAITTRITYRQGIAQADVLLGQVLRFEKLSQALTDQLRLLVVPADIAANNVAFGEFDRAMVQQRGSINDQFAAHQQRVVVATQGIRDSQQIITNIPADATVTIKWTQLQLATTAFSTALGAQNFLWAQRTDGQFVYHPDIAEAVSTWQQQFQARVQNVDPEVRDVMQRLDDSFANNNAGDDIDDAIHGHIRDMANTAQIPVQNQATLFPQIKDALGDIRNTYATCQNVADVLQDASHAFDPTSFTSYRQKVGAVNQMDAQLNLPETRQAFATMTQFAATAIQKAAEIHSAAAALTPPPGTMRLVEMGEQIRSVKDHLRNLGPQKFFISVEDHEINRMIGDRTKYLRDLKEAYSETKSAFPAPRTDQMNYYMMRAEHAIQRLEDDETRSTRLNAFSWAARVSSVLENLERWTDTSMVKSEDGRIIPVYTDIQARPADATSLSGVSPRPAALRAALDGRIYDAPPAVLKVSEFGDMLATLSDIRIGGSLNGHTQLCNEPPLGTLSTDKSTITGDGRLEFLEDLFGNDDPNKPYSQELTRHISDAYSASDTADTISFKTFYETLNRELETHIASVRDSAIQSDIRIRFWQLMQRLYRDTQEAKLLF